MSQSWQVAVGDPSTSALGLSTEGHLREKPQTGKQEMFCRPEITENNAL